MAQHPPDPDDAPDPATCYERAKPEKEAGMGRLDNNIATPADEPDAIEDAVSNAHEPHQINADEVVVVDRGNKPLDPLPQPAPDHNMFEEEPAGEDLMPTDIHEPRHKRHPRTEGKGGLD